MVTPLPTPEFVPGKTILETRLGQYRVVTDFKPNTKHTELDRRFFIEPLTDDAERMLELAAGKHNIQDYQFNLRNVPGEKETKLRRCVRADFIPENLPALLAGQVVKPEQGKDSVPSPERMEACLLKHPQKYSFEG